MKITERMLAAERLRLQQKEQHDMRRKWDASASAPIDSMAGRILEQAVRHYGIRAVLRELTQICDDGARRSAENFNTVLAKQWAAWAAALAALAGDKTGMIEPGRE